MKKHIRRITMSLCCILMAVIMLMSGTSCRLVVDATDLMEGYERTAEDSGEVTEAFKSKMAEFSMSLFSGVIDEKENYLVSPLSCVLCLALIANGANGETLSGIETYFGMDIESLNRNLYAYTSSLYTSDDCKINIADSIWFRDNDGGLHIKEEFLQANADWYNAQAYAAPFNESTVKDINNWCKYYTDGMIEKIIDKIESSTKMYLINALTFDAKWSVKYENSDIMDRTFNCYDGTSEKIPFLSSVEHVYLKIEGAQGFAKNYDGDKYSFVGILPDEGKDVYAFAASLTGTTWSTLWNSRVNEPVSAAFPEFSFASPQMNLSDALSSLGLSCMFGEADYSNMSNKNLQLANVFQKTFIQVDRNGTKAAAITVGEMKETAVLSEHIVIMDRPFVYAIVDNATGLPLFVGIQANC